VLEDPVAGDLVERIDVPFEERFAIGEALSRRPRRIYKTAA
jgi:hypothetical protein